MSAGSAPDDPPPPTALVVAGDEETRVLLRGLLRLHHFRVDGEAEGVTQALEMLREHPPTLLVVDLNLTEGSATALLQEVRGFAPTVRTILVAPASRPLPPRPEPYADVLLLRPFRIRQFAEALVAPAVGPAPDVA